MTIDEMQNAIMEAGYKVVNRVGSSGFIRTPDGYDFDFVPTSATDMERALRFAYKHLQEKKRLAALERKSLLLEAEVLILRHLVSGYVTMPPEAFFRAVAVWHFNMIKHHDAFTGDATKGREWLNDLPETIAFYKNIQGEE